MTNRIEIEDTIKMKKIDFHIHTVPTISDSTFTFDLNQLKEYIESSSIDAIAITNHNLFDIKQFETISSTINIPVFPGIEINLDDGHLLLISKNGELSDFASRCLNIQNQIKIKTDLITTDELKNVRHQHFLDTMA